MAFPSETIFPQERSASGQSALPERRWVRLPQWSAWGGRRRKRVKMVEQTRSTIKLQGYIYVCQPFCTPLCSANNILSELQLSYGGCY
ncbi:hypothetical protein K443DRAFT_238326 [Laccaria amethystina LaAM-08-1]|uniref:Uncharacterized protein n=1 Tax=Laccaria amethystina LaAM-08-1 TaxID=1095629 RepID=A0A0C9XJ74_9AGAR|nr:hypothetical protein K443DRAFT_238326 [Laccaria amethystina LaAM-08-1]